MAPEDAQDQGDVQDRAAPDGAAGIGSNSAFGAYLRTQRQLARLSQRQLARLTRISDPYLSQIERGLHQPSVAVIRAIADALELSAEELLAHAAGITDQTGAQTGGRSATVGVESAIRSDGRLSTSQKSALITVYRSMVGDTVSTGEG
jgi:transcriptional regulator with XRE-family HTH domain